MSEPIYDALVIGSGAAGAFAARELTAQGLSVVLLEAGRDVGAEDFDPARKKKAPKEINIWERAKATLKGQPVQARAAFFSEQFSHFFVNDYKNPYTTPKDAPFLWIRGRQGGGRLHSFGRVLLRWSDDDFKIRSRTGKGVDWPVSYEDLAPFYEEVETLLGLYGNEDGVRTLPDGAYSHPASLTPQELTFKALLEEECPGKHVTSWRYIAPDPQRTLRPMRDALESQNLSIRYNSIVRRILTDDASGLATGAEYVDGMSGEIGQVRAARVLLCASPVESVRLLLNSASAKHSNGIGNRSGVLGRYFMDQLPCLAMGSFPQIKGWAEDTAAPVDPFYNPSGGILVPRSTCDAAEDFLYQGSIGRAAVGHDEPSRMAFFGFGRMQPHADNRITLNQKRKDSWNIPVPHIECVMHADDLDLLRRQEKTLLEMLEKTGGELEFIGSPLGLREMGPGAYPNADPFSRFVFRKWFRKTMALGAAIHETGGARMGEDETTSVLNPWNQCWDAPNIMVTDASAFPGSGTAGTTLTVMALTLRACRELAKAG